MRLNKKYGGIQFFAPGINSYDIRESKSGATVIFVSTDFGSIVTFADNILTIAGLTIHVEQVNSEYVESYTEGVVDTATIVMKRQITAYDDTTHAITFGGASSASKSYDLSTSSKWANLADGEHTVTIKSKASNYGTSNFSNSVTVTKGATTYTLEAGTYKWVVGPNMNFSDDYLNLDNFLFTSNLIAYNRILVKKDLPFRGVGYFNDDGRNSVYDGKAWIDIAYRTITLSTPQTVTADFYNWAITGGNLVKQEGETWVLNETLSSNELNKDSVDFISNSQPFIALHYNSRDRVLAYNITQDSHTNVYEENGGGWTNESYRTITFTQPVTDTTLLTWLQENGTKQGGGN